MIANANKVGKSVLIHLVYQAAYSTNSNTHDLQGLRVYGMNTIDCYITSLHYQVQLEVWWRIALPLAPIPTFVPQDIRDRPTDLDQTFRQHS